MRRKKNQMSKVTVEVENGSLLWAQIMLQEGKCVTHDDLEFSDEEPQLLYLEWADNRICLNGVYENGDIIYYDYRELCDLPDTAGYKVIDVIEHQIKSIDNQIFDLTCKLTALELRKEKLLEKTNS